MPSAFYVSDGGRFVSSELTRGPWDEGSQHAGPPAALIARELERLPDAEGATDWQIGRITYEILRPVPIEPLMVEARVLRPGRSVQHLSASLVGKAGELVRASAWRVARQALELPAGLDAEERPFFRPATKSATKRRWSTDSSPAPFSNRGRRRCGCG